MDKVNRLKMSITNQPEWFILENENMDNIVFEKLINQFYDLTLSIYTGRDAIKGNKTKIDNEEIYVKDMPVKKQLTDDGKLSLKVKQEKVLNIIKALLETPSINIEVELTGITPQKKIVTRTITKPFNSNDVAELVPAYHGAGNN